MSLISKRLSVIKPSATLSITQKVIELKSQGVDIISFSAGEPDFDTPDNIKQAAIDGINNGATKYTNVAGTVELRKAIQSKFKRDNNLDYALDEIIASTGGKQVLYNLFMASLDKGDEVLIPAPYWVSYPDMVRLACGVPVFIYANEKDNFKITADQIESSITENTKWLILNSPSNPTGAIYSLQELKSIATVLRKHPHVHVVSDDIYEHIIFDNEVFHTLANVAPDLKARIAIVNGVSKAYSMTGWRIGYGAGQKALIKAMTIIQSQSTSNTSSVSQIAAQEALIGSQHFLQINTENFQTRRNLVHSMLSSGIKNFTCYKPCGAFYLFPKCSQFFGAKTNSGKQINNSTDFAEYLLEQAHVAVVPSIAFGIEGYYRISYATSMELLQKGCQRILNACSNLKYD